jgi:hypothetical protein
MTPVTARTMHTIYKEQGHSIGQENTGHFSLDKKILKA